MVFKHEEDDDEMTQKTKEWLAQFSDWAIKLMIVGIFGFGYHVSKTQDEMLMQFALQKQQEQAHIEGLKAAFDSRMIAAEKDIQVIKSNMVSLDVLKRVEQQLTIILLQSGIKHKVDLTSESQK
jgi:hypothetical protein